MKLVMIFHAHQPVGNPPETIKPIVERCYAPLIRTLHANPELRVAFHISGPLLDFLEAYHPDLLALVAEMTRRDQLEILGGGLTEPILGVLSRHDRLMQIQAMNERLETLFGVRPLGIWLAERAWFPDLPRDIVDAGMVYLVLDDFHALAAGVPSTAAGELWWTEHEGRRLMIFFGLKALRYFIPFRPWDEIEKYLRKRLRRKKAQFLCYADDAEKFGAWPGTDEWVYREGWLERFIQGLLTMRPSLTLALPREVIHYHPPHAMIYIPSSTYDEMQTWTIHPNRLKRLPGRFYPDKTDNRFRGLIRGGDWRAFLHRYPESYQMYARMMAISSELEKRSLSPHDKKRLLEAQCNDAYWHGVFAGVYAPHLVRAVYERLLGLERKIWRPPVWREVNWLPSGKGLHGLMPAWDVLVDIHRGGECVEWHHLEPVIVGGRVMRRRPEAYHFSDKRGALTHGHRGIASLHERPVESSGRGLVYDPYPRYSGTVLFLENEKSKEVVEVFDGVRAWRPRVMEYGVDIDDEIWSLTLKAGDSRGAMTRTIKADLGEAGGSCLMMEIQMMNKLGRTWMVEWQVLPMGEHPFQRAGVPFPENVWIFCERMILGEKEGVQLALEVSSDASFEIGWYRVMHSVHTDEGLVPILQGWAVRCRTRGMNLSIRLHRQ